MKIAVVGIGVAGAYLINRLNGDHDNHIIGFERMPYESHDAVCAWATCDSVMAELIKECGLNFENYVLHNGKNMQVDLGNNSSKDNINIRLKGMVTYDKLKLIQDMIKGTDIQFGKVPKKNVLENDFDLIIDSTGFHRNYLPKPIYEMWIPCVQYKVRYKQGREPYDDFYLKAFPSMSGYFWYFPLGDGYSHIGAGDFERKNNNAYVEEFLKMHECEVVKKVGRPVRISPPRESEPFTDGRKTIGVGESIGTVYPLLGEGIIPSTWCAQLFVENMHNFDMYRKAVLKKFNIYSLIFKFIKMKISGKFNIVKNLIEVFRIYNHMKGQESRYGMEVKIADLIKVSKI